MADAVDTAVPAVLRRVVGSGGNNGNGVRESNAAAVLAAVRVAAPLSRAEIARRTGLSVPTVSRQVGELIELELLRDLPGPLREGGVGRPTVPVELNDVVAACGVHIGVTTTTYGLADLRGNLLTSERVPTPTTGAARALAELGAAVRALCRSWPDRRIIGVGLATGGRVDDLHGLLEHERLGWSGVPARAALAEATGLPVRLNGHLPAMAAAELLFGDAGLHRSSLYFYARQTVGVAIAAHGRLHRGPGRAGTIAHLPVGGDAACPCGRTGCLEATVAEQRVVEAAARTEVISLPDIGALREAALAGSARARRILSERARALGRAVGLLRDIVDPELVVLGGQAITDAPEYLDDLLRAFADTTVLPGTDLVQVTRFGPDVQAVAACAGLLAELYDHPLSFGSGGS